MININARCASIWTGITQIQTDVDKIYMYLKILATHTISLLLLHPFTLREVLEDVNKDMAQNPWSALPNYPDEDIWSYYGLLHIYPIVFDDHLVIILQVPLVEKSLIMKAYKVYNLAILHPTLKKVFQNSLEALCPGLFSDGNYATIPLEHAVLICAFTKGHMCRLDTALYHTEKIMWCLLFVEKAEKIQ